MLARGAPPGGHERYQGGARSGREMPSFCIFFCSVERFIPKRVAAPLGPPTTQSGGGQAARTMCSRSASVSFIGAGVASAVCPCGGEPASLTRRTSVQNLSTRSPRAR